MLTSSGLLTILRGPGATFDDAGDALVPRFPAGRTQWLQVCLDPQVAVRSTMPGPTVIVHEAVDVWLWLLERSVPLETAEAACALIADHLGTWRSHEGTARPIAAPGSVDAVTQRLVVAEAPGEAVALEDLIGMGVGHELARTAEA
jgi:hypothetical protein